MIAPPRLVQTGLLSFPDIFFYETGYSIYTLRQASRRSWRIGQRSNVNVKFFFYTSTMQEAWLRLMGKKLLISLAMGGKFASDGLQAIDEGDDILMAMARELVTEKGIGESADLVWKQLQRQQAEVFGVRVAETLPSEVETEPSAGTVPEVVVHPVAAIPAVVTQLLMFGMEYEAIQRHKAPPQAIKSRHSIESARIVPGLSVMRVVTGGSLFIRCGVQLPYSLRAKGMSRPPSERKGSGLARVPYGNQVKRTVIHRQPQGLLKGIVLESSDRHPTQPKCHRFQKQVLRGVAHFHVDITRSPRGTVLA